MKHLWSERDEEMFMIAEASPSTELDVSVEMVDRSALRMAADSVWT